MQTLLLVLFSSMMNSLLMCTQFPQQEYIQTVTMSKIPSAPISVVYWQFSNFVLTTQLSLIQPPFSIFGLHNFNLKNTISFSPKKNVSTSLYFVFHRNSAIIATQSMPYLIHLQGGSQYVALIYTFHQILDRMKEPVHGQRK